MLQDGVAWFEWRGSPSLARNLTVASRFGVAWLGLDTVAARIDPGDTGIVAVRFRNTGHDTLGLGHTAVSVSYHWLSPQGATVTYEGVRTPLTVTLAPGDSTTVAARIAGPPRVGDFVLVVDLVQDGVAWYSWDGLPTLDVPVAGPRQAVRWVSTPGPIQALQGRSEQVTVTLTNTGSFPWSATGTDVVTVGYRVRNAAGTMVLSNQRVLLPHDVSPGQSVSVAAVVTAPASRGTYYIDWDLFQAGRGWLSWFGASTSTSLLTVSRLKVTE
jgi:hypothetical protein